ncbi:hypothetical protein B0H63DRAFT_300250 [Podospora didyma]|uniref:Secreted protein n=1 Tax=Podospora didyma TaxID=330526 RepID=A0AAE0N729_9PEZI|nr:hypothetical protein B0H63DRAFT_300250 [Podospora didyma]
MPCKTPGLALSVIIAAKVLRWSCSVSCMPSSNRKARAVAIKALAFRGYINACASPLNVRLNPLRGGIGLAPCHTVSLTSCSEDKTPILSTVPTQPQFLERMADVKQSVAWRRFNNNNSKVDIR